MGYFVIKELKGMIQSSIDIKLAILEDQCILEQILESAILMENSINVGGKILFAGNGGSAADAQHLAAELVSRFEIERGALPGLALTTDTSIITAIGNDYGFENIFQRQLEAIAKAQDIFVGITTSGKSKNILAGFKQAKSMGLHTIALCGMGGEEIDDLVDIAIRVPSSSTPRIQEAHILIGHILCAIIERSHVKHAAIKL